MMDKIRLFIAELMRKPTLRELAAKELYEAEIHRLNAQSAKEFAIGLIAYRDSQVSRLKKFIAEIDQKP